jgi:hypothetical protein
MTTSMPWCVPSWASGSRSWDSLASRSSARTSRTRTSIRWSSVARQGRLVCLADSGGNNAAVEWPAVTTHAVHASSTLRCGYATSMRSAHSMLRTSGPKRAALQKRHEGFPIAFLRFDGGARIEVMTTCSCRQSTAPACLRRATHLAVSLGGEQAVARHGRLRARHPCWTLRAAPGTDTTRTSARSGGNQSRSRPSPPGDPATHPARGRP